MQSLPVKFPEDLQSASQLAASATYPVHFILLIALANALCAEKSASKETPTANEVPSTNQVNNIRVLQGFRPCTRMHSNCMNKSGEN
jgi:hypothetical protein